MSYTGTPERMEATADQIQKVPQNLDDAYSALQRAVAIYQSSNNGATVDAYTAVQSQWGNEQSQIQAAGLHASNALREIADTMRSADRSGAGQFQ